MIIIQSLIEYIDDTQTLAVMFIGSMFIAPVLATVAAYIA